MIRGDDDEEEKEEGSDDEYLKGMGEGVWESGDDRRVKTEARGGTQRAVTRESGRRFTLDVVACSHGAARTTTLTSAHTELVIYVTDALLSDVVRATP